MPPSDQNDTDEGHGHAAEELLPLRQVQDMVLSRTSHLETVEVPIEEALGCFLAEPVTAPADIPPFANSAMDGYAVRSSDTGEGGTELSVRGVLPAGSPPPDEPIGPGEAIQIMTGAVMPPGADAVAIVERTERLGAGRVRILGAVSPGANVRSPGSDFKAGERGLSEGDRIGPGQVAVLASFGLATAAVVRRPRVGVFSTGDELVGPGAPLKPGQIRDSNRQMLLAALSRDGFDPVDLGTAPDTEEAVESVLGEATKRCDAVLSSGGVSRGEFDLVKVVLSRLAAEKKGEAFEIGVSIRPAKPLMLAFLPRSGGGPAVACFGLPGNPVSSLVSYNVVALPGLAKMAGNPKRLPRSLAAITSEDLRPSRDGRLNLVRVEGAFGADGRLLVRPAGGQQSHQLSGTLSANCLAMVPPGEPIRAGSPVEVIPIGPLL